MLGRRGRGRQEKTLAGLFRWEQNKGEPGFIFIPDDFVLNMSSALKTSEPRIPSRLSRRIPAVPAWKFVLGKDEET